MGIPNAVARTIAVPGLTTTVLTLAITGIAAGSVLAGGPGSKAAGRLIATMLAGAFSVPCSSAAPRSAICLPSPWSRSSLAP